LTAFKYYYVPMGQLGLGGIVVKPTPDLLRLQQELIDAVTLYTVKTATAAAFYTTPEEPHINPSVIDYIATSMADLSGGNFSPHVTIGIGTAAFWRRCWPSHSPPSPSRQCLPRSISSVTMARRASS
jgi:hypothetical protein